jgi:uncharacterized membrane protein
LYQPYLLALHVTATALVVGTLFLQSLVVVMALRLPNPTHREGVRLMQRRVHLYIYYPILAAAVLTGLWLAWLVEAFEDGHWLYWKLVLVVVLVGLGLLTGGELRRERVAKGPALAVHIVIFVVSTWIIFLATAKPA